MPSPTLTQIRHQTAARPFLKWAGGKGQLLQQYQPLLPKKFRHYYEPFLGGGALYFALQPKTAFLMDINVELVNVYGCVRDRVDELLARLAVHQRHHGPEYYYEVRAQHALSDDWFQAGLNLDRAARLIYLNKTCFNGLYRENSKGFFNVPIGRYKNPGICDPDLLRSASQLLQATSIEVQSFDVILEHATTKQDFVYFDPPYYPISDTSKFTSYSRYAFNVADQIRLRDTFVALADRGVKVMLSNSDCPFIRDLYQGYPIQTIYATRNINSKASKRGKITEVVVTSY
jgi:DNA adenine methylase